MRLPAVLSLCLIVALAAPPSLAEDAKPAPLAVAKPEAIKWPKLKPWYEPAEEAEALRTAKLLGRPIAIAWYVDGKHMDDVARWKRSDVARYFVGFSVTEKLFKKDGKNKYTITHPLVKRIHGASGIGKVKAPCLFLATWNGEYLGSIPRDIKDDNIINTAAKDAVKKYGKLLRARQANAGWRSLMAARKLWNSGRHDAAMKHYRNAMVVAGVNPRMALSAELNKDALAIDDRGATHLSVAREQYKRREFDKAESTARKIHSVYKGFETAESAKTLFKAIQTARKEPAVAAKEIKKGPAEKPPTKPTADDKPAAGDDEKDNDDNNRGDGKEEGDYEDDF